MNRNAASTIDDPSSEIVRLVETLRETEQRLQELAGDDLDAVLLSGGQSYLLQEAQQKLRLSEEQFHSMFTSAATGIAISTPNGHYLHVNPAYCQMLGYTEDELLKTDFAELTHPEDITLNTKLRDEMLAGQRENFTFEKRYLKKSGEIVWVSASVSAVHAVGGEISTLTVMAENITERKMAEFHLHRINRLHNVLSKIGEAIVRNVDRQSLYEAVCQIIIEVGLLRTAFIAEVDAEARVATFTASYGEGLEYLHGPLSVIPLDGGPLSQGIVGTVVRTGVHDVCNDIVAAPRMKPWLPAALKLGVFATAGFPLKLRGVTIAVLILRADEVGYFLEDEIELMDAVASDISFALEAMEKETERKRAEESLQANQAELQILFDLMPAMLCAKDKKNVFLRVNQRLAESAGMSVNEIEGKSAEELFPNEAAKYYADDLEVIESGKPKLAIIEKLKSGNGDELWVQTDKVPLRDKNGQVSGILVMIQDITERKQLEDSQQRLQERYKRLVDSNVQGVIFWERNGKISGANDAFLRLIHHSRDDLEAGRINWMKLTPPEHAHLDRCCLEEIDAKGIGTPYEKDFVLEDGTRVPVLLGSAAFKDNINEGVSFVVDLTERKKLEQQFFRAQRLESIGTLTSGIAHDFNNLLSIIIGNLDILHSLLNADSASLKHTETAQKAALRGADLTRRLLAFSSNETLAPTSTSLDHLIRNTLAMTDRVIGPEIKIATHFDESISVILVDAPSLEQALVNLLVNARDAMPKGGTITITSRFCNLEESYPPVKTGELKPGSYACISVSDTGSGMSKQTLERVFEPFFTTKPRGKGTGLGLAMVYGFVKQSHGTVRIYSELGFGTTVTIYLPLTKDASLTQEEVAEPSSSVNGDAKVLVVDDEIDLLDIAATFLAGMGYKTFTAVDGQDALQVIKREKDIDLIVTDIIMPGGMNGVELAQKVRQLNPKIKVIYCSGFTADSLAERNMPLAEGLLLHKPYQRDEFSAMVRRVMATESKEERLL
jgi:PAS domain S-box-containing protein